MRSVCGCTPASSAATLMMYSARSRGSESFFTAPPPLPLDAQPGARGFLLRFPELGQQLLLVLGQPLRHLHVHRDQEVAGAVLLRCAPAADPKRPTVRGAGRDLQRDRT